MPTVEKLNVEIGANIPQLSSDMRRAEAVVDSSAKRMARSTRLVDRSLGGRQAWLGGMSVVGGMLALGRAIENYTPGSMSGGTGPDNTAFDKATAAVLDFADSLMKSIPILSDFYQLGNSMDKWMERMFFGATSDDQFNAYKYIEALMAKSKLHEGPIQEAHGQFTLDTMKIAQELQEELERIQQFARVGIDPKLIAQMRDIAGHEAELKGKEAEAKRDKALDKAFGNDRKQKFDTISTVFGQFKSPQMNGTTAPAAETAKNTKEMKKDTKALLKAVQSLVNKLQPFA